MATVSIGIPVYNGGRFLAESLESLAAQTYEDIEFFISDNGSTDETEEICRAYAARDARIHYSRADVNRGASWNFNRVARETRGRYFKWASHDDLLAPTYIERCVEAFEAAPPSVALIYPQTRIIDEAGNVIRDYEDRLDMRQAAPYERLEHLVRNIVMANAAFGLIRRSTVARSRLLAPFPSSDYVMLGEFSMLGQFWELPERLFMRREHAGMSRLANPSAAEVAEWFAPGSSEGRRVIESWRLFFEFLRSIHSMPLDGLERSRCYGAFTRVWLRRAGPRMLTEPFGLDYTRGWNPLRRPRNAV